MALLQIAEPGQSAAPHQQKLAVGIDLGTTNSLIATVRNGHSDILLDEQNRPLLPSVVHFGKDENVIVGYEAAELATQDPQNTVISVKRLIGRGLADIQQRYPNLPYQFVASENGLPLLATRQGVRSPIEISAEILKKLTALGEQRLGGDLVGAVITVPAYFDDAQRQSTKDAAKLAGLNVLRLLNEPTAAAIAYGLDSGQEGVIAVYDLGGGTFDISILRLSRGVFEVLATGGDTALGGDDFDLVLADWIIEQSAVKPENDSQYRELIELANHVKVELTNVTEAKIQYRNWLGNISREQFNELIQPLVKRSLLACRRALKDAGVEVEDVNEVVMVGGSTRVPYVREQVGEFFQKQPMSFHFLSALKPWAVWWKKSFLATPPFLWRVRKNSLPSKTGKPRCRCILYKVNGSWLTIAVLSPASRCAAFHRWRPVRHIFVSPTKWMPMDYSASPPWKKPPVCNPQFR